MAYAPPQALSARSRNFVRGSSSAVLIGVAAFGVGACQGAGFGGLGAACPSWNSGDPLTANFSADPRANAKIRTFVAASKDLMQLSLQMEAMTVEACSRMALDVGATQAELVPPDDQPGSAAKAACGAFSARMDAILAQGVGVRVQAKLPQCQADLQARARCEGACDVSVDPGQIVASCEPAKLSGFCQGRCVGRCDGRCTGQCNGQCSQVDASGQCVGQCNGECNGGCDATCHVGCQGQWQAPQCEGSVRPPSADAECNASCTAQANFRASCTPAEVYVQTWPDGQSAAMLAATLQANLPKLLHAEFALGKRLINDAQVVVQVGGQLPKIIGQAGLQALACVGAAADASVKASVRVQVSVQASASVSGRAGVQG